VGLDGQWPESGQRWQTVQKNQWGWECKQRTAQVHTGVPMQLFLDIEKAGEHEILFSLREDGVEMDKFVLASRMEFKPEGKGPAEKLKSGPAPAAFAEVAEAAPAAKAYPQHWGEPPPVQTMDYVPLPGGYGNGSSTLAKWIQAHLDQDATATSSQPNATPGALTMEVASFLPGNTGYYLDKGKWLAINPAKNKEARAAASFAFAEGKYNVTLHAVGESDGQCPYQVLVNGDEVGRFTCPRSTQTYEEGKKFTGTWKNIQINAGDVIEVASQIASADGKEFSRARWSRVVFEPADEATRKANGPLLAAAVAPSAAVVASASALVQPRQSNGKGAVEMSGELKQWHKVTLTLDGPFAAELDNDPNPFTDYNFTVTFTHESGSPSYKVPGYFAADGNAGETSATAGTKWRSHLSPDKTGKWNYIVSFTKGKDAALDGGGAALQPFDGVTGSLTVAATDKTGRDFRAKGRLQYVGKHYLQFAGSKEYFLKAGADAPETFLGYVDFDNTEARKPKVPLKTWSPHVKDWKVGDPTWKGGKGKGMIGAINHLASKGANAFSFLTYNAGGDGDNVWPFVQRDDKMHYDCSKLAQWAVVFDHAQQLGLYLHFKTQETENDDLKGPGAAQSLDGGDLGPQRKLYYRELIARFAYELALNWNFGEENTQTPAQQRAEIDYVAKLDPYSHLRVIHTFPGQQDKVYTELLGDRSLLTGASLQNEWDHAHQRTLQWVTESAKAGQPWVVANDEQGSAAEGVPPDPGYEGFSGKTGAGEKAYGLNEVRKYTLWGTLMAGGQGVEYYFGYKLAQNDLICEDYRSRDRSWDYCRVALEFFPANKIPIQDMKNANALIGNTKNDNSKYCFAKAGELYLVYLPKGGTTGLDLAGASGNFTVKWFNPRTGGALQNGSVKSVPGGSSVALGQPPADATEDWVVLLRR